MHFNPQAQSHFNLMLLTLTIRRRWNSIYMLDGFRIGRRAHCNGAQNLPLLTLFTKKNEPCSLCDQAKQVLKKYSSQFHYTETYIDDPENREWFERYRYDIPVIHLDGKFLMQHRVSEGQLRRALERSRREKELAENS